MATYGEIRLRATQLCPGQSPEKIDGWMQDAYTEILDRLEWKRRESEVIFQVPASYAIGSTTVTQGSASVVGAGTTWTAGMTGRMIRFGNQGEFYIFTYVSVTTGTLDRAYEAADEAGLAYRIDQHLFVLPATCRIVRGVKPLHDNLRPLPLTTPAELDRLSISRNAYGVPKTCAPTYDDASSPPRMQLEFYPIFESPAPSGSTASFSVDMITDTTALDDGATSTSLLPWVRPAALLGKVQASCDRHRASAEGKPAFLATAQAHEAKADNLVLTMAQINARQRGAQEIRTPDWMKVRRGSGYGERDVRHAPFEDGDWGFD